MAKAAALTDEGRDHLMLGASILGPAALAWFGFELYKSGESQNIATFALWGLLDYVFCASAWHADSRKEAFFAGLYGTVAFIVVWILYRNGNWSFGFEEKACTLGVIAALAGWGFTRNPNAAIVISSIAAVIAGVPVLMDAFHHPALWTLGLWVPAAIAALVMLTLAPSWEPKDWLFSGTSAAFCSSMSLIIIVRAL